MDESRPEYRTLRLGDAPLTKQDAIEWVEGQPAVERMYALWTILVFALSLAFAALTFFSLGVELGLFPARVWFLGTISAATGGEVFVTFTAVATLTDFVLRRWMLRRRPGCVRIGISPRGLAVRTVVRTIVYPWQDFRWMDATHIALGRKFERVQLALTAGQTAAVVRFVQPPLSSSRR